MGEVSIFKQKNAVANTTPRELSTLAKSLVAETINRRIQTNTNGTFRRVINGEQIGNAIRGEIDVIIVDALPKVSRVFYAEQFDPAKEAKLPNCWSSLGDRPDPASPSKQNENCADCPQNIKGSGGGDRRACRFQRRVAVLLVGDDSGDVYQFNIPSKSLFGKGSGNVHPFESYAKFLAGNKLSIDGVVTNISYDLNADSMELLFTPQRETSDDEYALVQAAQAKPETHRLLTINAVAKREDKKEEKVSRSEEPEEEVEVKEPTKRGKRTQTTVQKNSTSPSLADSLHDWGKD